MIRRVTCAAIPVASFALFAWLPFFYLALNHRTRSAYRLAAATFALSVMEAFALATVTPNGWGAKLMGFSILFYMAGAALAVWSMMGPPRGAPGADGAPLTSSSHT